MALNRMAQLLPLKPGMGEAVARWHDDNQEWLAQIWRDMSLLRGLHRFVLGDTLIEWIEWEGSFRDLFNALAATPAHHEEMQRLQPYLADFEPDDREALRAYLKRITSKPIYSWSAEGREGPHPGRPSP